MSIKADMNFLMGWISNPEETERILSLQQFPSFGAVSSQFGVKESGRGKRVELYKYVEQLTGSWNQRQQGDSDCTSQALATAIDGIKSVEILINGDLEEWVGETVTESIYGGSRVQIGGGRLRGQGGSYGSWVCEFAKQYGCVARQKYGNIDLSKYNVNTVRAWADSGVPKEILEQSKLHPIKSFSRINNYYEMIDSLANGYLGIICCNFGFTTVRDKDGFCNLEGVWPHAQCVCGFDDTGARKGILIANSWGPYVQGIPRYDEPRGMYYVDAEVFDKMCQQQGAECLVVSDYNGYPMKKLPLRLF